MKSNEALYKVLAEDSGFLMNFIATGHEGLCIGFTLGVEIAKRFPEETDRLFEQWKEDGMMEFSSEKKGELIDNLMKETTFD